MIPHAVKLGFALVVLCLPTLAQVPSKNERTEILRLCEQYFGPAVDAKLNLYAANSFYVLEVVFDAKNRLEKLSIVPRYYFEKAHPEWKESKPFEYLSWIEYQNLLARADLIKPRGQLITPPPPFSVVTNVTAWETSIYENAKLTVGVLADALEPEDSPVRVKWFKLGFGKLAKAKERKSSTEPLDFF